jgi:diacylglycerol O-acyltransferase-1
MICPLSPNLFIFSRNVTLSNIYYFWLAPTLTYQVAFPRLPRINWFRVLSLMIRLVVSSCLILFLVAQVVQPNLDSMMKDMERNKLLQQSDSSVKSVQGSIIANYILKLAIASTYIWLLVFYAFFHVFLNLMAELSRFGDRLFYKDWWNSSTVEAYWRFWNQPVHYWLVRHLYFPCIRGGCSKAGAMFMVFLISAVVHEVLISVPFHLIRPWSFLGMMMQIPLVLITKYFDERWPGSSFGNIIFWISFCIVGQPVCFHFLMWSL